MDPFYEKYLDAGGIPVVSSSLVPDAALISAREIIDEMLAFRPDIRTTIAETGVRVAIMAVSEVTTDIPEHSDLNEAFPEVDWDTRARGLGATLARPATSGAEENILCYSHDVYPNEDILVHEFAHTIFLIGVELQEDGRDYRKRLEAAYRDALEAGLWANTYAGENPDEYWAEGVQSWFGLNDPPGPIHNEVNTRSELVEYDPVLAGLILEILGDGVIQASCHTTSEAPEGPRISGRVLGPDGEPLQGVGLWAWQGGRSNSGFATTGRDGRFSIPVPEGSFTLDIYPGEGCRFVGWYDGKGSLATTKSQAATLEVDKDGIDGIDIRLPEQAEDLPRIEWCS